MPKKKDIDDIDRKIMQEMYKKGSITNRQVAETIGLTPGPTLVRTTKLLEKGYLIDNGCDLNWAALGYPYEAQVFSSLYEKESHKYESIITNTPGIVGSKQVVRKGMIDNKTVHYVSTCVFESADIFVSTWGDILGRCEYPVSVEVWELSPRKIKQNKKLNLLSIDPKFKRE